MKILVAGLGLIGASIAKTLKKNTSHYVMGWNRTVSVSEKALADGAVDEIGDYEDIRAIEAVLNCGCRILATVHGNSIEDIEKKPLLKRFLTEKIFQRYVLLGNRDAVGSLKGIFDERGTRLC